MSRSVRTGWIMVAALASTAALAQTPVGKLTGVQGNVLVSGPTGMSAATEGQALPPNVRVITTAGAKATVAYDKGCQVALGENRRYTVREQAECSEAKAPPLGAATGFVVLAGARVPSVGETELKGNLGVSPGNTVTGFPPGRVLGETNAANDKAAQAQKDALAAYNDALQQTCNTRLTGQDLGGQSLTAGVYCFPASPARQSGELELDGQGDLNSIFIFQVGTALTAADKASIKLVNGAQACNVYWVVGDSVTLGKEARFAGTIMAINAVSAGNKTTMTGRAFSRNGAVSLDASAIDSTPCVPVVAWWATPLGTAAAVGGAVGVGAGIYEITQSKSPN